MSSMAELRALIVAQHPETARCCAGGAGRMLPIAQIIADWATHAGQEVLQQHPKASKARRLALESKRGFDASAYVAARSRAREQLATLAHWDAAPAARREAA